MIIPNVIQKLGKESVQSLFLKIKFSLIVIINLIILNPCSAEEISPYKFTDCLPFYEIPVSSRYVIHPTDEADVIYYFTPPKALSYPIAIVCGGSSTEEDIHSIIHLHRYFLAEFLDLNAGVVTVEQQGVDGNLVNLKEFIDHYTRSNRLKDHQIVIEYLKKHPPVGWNGKFIFFGVSEGGHLVTSLTTQYADSLLATINWSGAGDWAWRDELWAFLQKLLISNPECPHELKLNECSICLEHIGSRDNYDAFMDAILADPSARCKFLEMTYKYHADAMRYPNVDYQKIQTPFLVVAGTEDSFIQSCDAFVEKAKNSNITYIRVENMDHYVRKRPDIMHQSFEWLRCQLMHQAPKANTP